MSSSDLGRDLRRALDPAQLLRVVGMTADEWQELLLRERPRRALVLCARQVGKSTAAAAAALHEAIYNPAALILMISATQRQSGELLRRARLLLGALPGVGVVSETTMMIELRNGSRILSLPATEDTIRGYSAVALIVLDEAARVPDELYFSLRPMLATSDGRLLALSTPNRQRGWFYEAWSSDQPWIRTKVTAAECPRISPAYLAEERQNMTAAFYASEYECEFGDTIDTVFSHQASPPPSTQPSPRSTQEDGDEQGPLPIRPRHRPGPRPDALAVIEHETRPRHPVYNVRALHRYPLGTPYPVTADQISERLRTPPLYRNSLVAIDTTGVGAPVVDLIKTHRNIYDVYAITITGGTTVGKTGYDLTVPKRDLITKTAILFQQQRIRIAAGLSDTAQLVDELHSYRIKTSDTGHHTYAPAHSSDHDDLLLALALALWIGEHRAAKLPATISKPTGCIPTQHDRFGRTWF
jgi:hypothetical protein